MSNQKYRSRLEHVLTIMLTKCMRADGKIPRFMISQVMRPYLSSHDLDTLLQDTCVKLIKEPLAENIGPGRRASHYSSVDVLQALQDEQKRLEEIVTIQEGVLAPASSFSRRRLQHFTGEDEEVEDAANGVVK